MHSQSLLKRFKRKWPFRPFIGLHIKVLVPALILSIAGSLALFGWFGQKLARESREHLRARLDDFASTQAAELAEPIWVFDQISIDRLFRNYRLNEELLAAKLLDSKGYLLAQTELARPSEPYKTFTAARKITWKSAGDTYHIGTLEVTYQDAGVRRMLADGRRADLLTVFCLIVLLAGATAWAIHWRVGAPLRRLRESLDRNKSEGSREPLLWSSRDELGDVVAAYNALLADIDRQTRHLEVTNDALKTENQQRIQAEEALRKSEQQLNLVLEASRDGFWDWDLRTGEFCLSERLHEQLGYTVGELEPRIDVLRKLCHPKDYERLVSTISSRLRKQVDLSLVSENRFLTRSGECRWIMTRAKAFRDEAGKTRRVIGTATDITDRKRAEEERARLAKALEQADEAILITDVHGIVGYANPAFERIFGYTAAEVVGTDISELDSGIPGSPSCRSIWATLVEGAVWRGRLIQRKKDGVPLELAATLSPVRDSSGEVINHVVIARDVSEEIELQRKLQRAQKMEAIGTLAGGIAHDFNNVLAIILGYTEMMLASRPLSETMKDSLGQVAKAVARAREVVRQILVISRSKLGGEPTPVHLKELIEEDLRFLRATVPTTIEIRRNYRTESDVVLADKTQINQVIMNLCTNAAHAMEDKGGVLEVGLAREEIHDHADARSLGLAPGTYLRLDFRDTGYGMDSATIERIFDPYFTTKDVGKGSGLGLAVVDGIVKRCRGAVSVFSAPGRGSVFSVYLPTAAEVPAPPEPARVESIPRGPERILFVDDEKALAEIGQEMLGVLGYEVLSTTSSRVALDELRSRPDAFDLLITDYTMPAMTGLDLAKEAMKVRTDLPVILSTGFSEKITEESVKEDGIRAFLMKPYNLRSLADTVRRVLDGHTHVVQAVSSDGSVRRTESRWS